MLISLPFSFLWSFAWFPWLLLLGSGFHLVSLRFLCSLWFRFGSLWSIPSDVVFLVFSKLLLLFERPFGFLLGIEPIADTGPSYRPSLKDKLVKLLDFISRSRLLEMVS